ncbi:hypothetical protein E4U41_000649 [Claviceps citrina]|nr:hypothetical protein E4U41_000649 [Claviceps citrina]
MPHCAEPSRPSFVIDSDSDFLKCPGARSIAHRDLRSEPQANTSSSHRISTLSGAIGIRTP